MKLQTLIITLFLSIGTIQAQTTLFKNVNIFNGTSDEPFDTRFYTADELPELINVVKGDMSLVGPRPLLMRYLNRYTPEQKRRHNVKPGITGLWQCTPHRNSLPFDRWVALDLQYIDQWSLWLDLKILLKTIFIFFSAGCGW